ncbi:MAG: hypothetical protein ACOVRN_14825 [Flavobacterium sp.]
MSPIDIMYRFIHNMGTPTRNTAKYDTPIPTEAKTVSLFSQPYLDTYNQCYKNIVVVNLKPQGPLGEIVRFVKFPPLSEFKQATPCNPLKDCGYALMSLDGCGCGTKFGSDLMVVDEVPTLISYLLSNGYTVDTSITKMFNTSDIRFDTNLGNKLICFITYQG